MTRALSWRGLADPPEEFLDLLIVDIAWSWRYLGRLQLRTYRSNASLHLLQVVFRELGHAWVCAGVRLACFFPFLFLADCFISLHLLPENDGYSSQGNISASLP